jgi:glucokinase
VTHAVGIDVGGTKIAAGLVDVARGHVVDREELPTKPQRGGSAVLADCAAMAARLGGGEHPVGIGLCELVDLAGRPAAADTVDWRGLDVAAAIGAPLVVLGSDVRAAAHAEARFGAGANRSPFLFAIVGTGASACLVVDGEPYAGAHGHAIVLGAPPVEGIASGLALTRRTGVDRAEAVLADPAHDGLVHEAALALGQVLAVLVNALDPNVIVLGGGLGGNPAFRERVAAAARPLVEAAGLRAPEFVGSALGRDGGVLGAALSALADRAR